MRNRGILLAALAVLLLAGLSPLAADTVIQRGVDTFTTTANGKTFYNFAKNPIPAGFFCRSSAPFTGRVTLKGLPLETGTPGPLHGADTVIERLDDAAFDATGTADDAHPVPGPVAGQHRPDQDRLRRFPRLRHARRQAAGDDDAHLPHLGEVAGTSSRPSRSTPA